MSLGTTVRMASGKSALEARLENPTDCQPVGVMALVSQDSTARRHQFMQSKSDAGVHMFSARKVVLSLIQHTLVTTLSAML